MDEENLMYCCEEMEIEVADYFLTLSEFPYQELCARSRERVQQTFKHTKSCDKCGEVYNYLKNVFEIVNQDIGEGFFSAEELKMIKRNEKYLEKII